MAPGPYDLTLEDLGALLEGEPAYRVRQVWDGLHRQARAPLEMTDVPLALRRRLADAAPPALREIRRTTTDDDATVKWLFEAEGGALLETVYMRYPRRATVCVSTQAGCAMACQFCATGQAGFTRNLSTGEILEQVATAARQARPGPVTHVVFMGMGEPLANYDRVWPAVVRLHDEFGLSARRLTLSTVGMVPGIKRLTAEELPVNLAVSLHAANDALRDELVPINRRYPLAVLIASCADYVERTRRRLSFEWALIAGVNDRPADASELAALARPLGAHVNLIPLNPTPGYGVPGSPPSAVLAFHRALDGLGVNATVRRTRGVEIDAACGQLAGPVARRVDVTVAR